jgi:hypothetical protein
MKNRCVYSKRFQHSLRSCDSPLLSVNFYVLFFHLSSFLLFSMSYAAARETQYSILQQVNQLY